MQNTDKEVNPNLIVSLQPQHLTEQSQRYENIDQDTPDGDIIQDAFDDAKKLTDEQLQQQDDDDKIKELVRRKKSYISHSFIKNNKYDKVTKLQNSQSLLPDHKLNSKNLSKEEMDLLINQMLVGQVYDCDFDEEHLDKMSKITVGCMKKRSCWSRWFGALTPGSMRGSIFALMQTALGAGILALPYTFAQCGLAVGIIFLLVGSFISYWTMIWLLHAANWTKKDNYAHVVDTTLGKCAAIFLHIVFILLCQGAVVLYFIVSTTFMPKTFQGFGMDKEFTESFQMRVYLCFGIVIGLFPLAIQRNLSGLAHFSFVGILAIIYTVFLIIAQSPFYMMQNFSVEKIKWYDLRYVVLLQGYSQTVLSFTSHTNIFMVRIELTKPIEKRFRKIFFRSITWELALYMAVSVFGYLSFLDDTQPLVIDRDPIPGAWDKDYLMLFGRLGTFTLMLTSITIMAAPCRNQILTFFRIKRKTNTFEHVSLTLLIYISSAVIAIFFPDVIAYFAFLGGTTCVALVFFFPFLLKAQMNTKLKGQKWYSIENLLLHYINFILSLMGLAAAALSLMVTYNVIDNDGKWLLDWKPWEQWTN